MTIETRVLQAVRHLRIWKPQRPWLEAKQLRSRLGVPILASNRRPFSIETYSVRLSGGSLVVSVCGKNPYSGCSSWWVFVAGPGEAEGAATRPWVAGDPKNAPGNIRDLAETLIADLRRIRASSGV